MEAHCDYWYLEHVSTGKKLILQSGENSVGRHSCCKFVLKDYNFLSRQHAKFIVDQDNNVCLEQLNALNGIFINESKLVANTQRLNSDDIIGLGVEVESSDAVVPPNYAIFQLKLMSSNDEDIVLISDDEVDDGTVPNDYNIDAVKQEGDEINNAANKPDNEKSADASPNPNRVIHLPKLPEVKQEILSQASKDIENIFGEADEEFLESVYQINPYVYKQLNNKNVVTTGEKIYNGDIIELLEKAANPEISLPENGDTPEQPPEYANLPKTPPPPLIGASIIVDDNDDDYDENMALSLREMKDEMAEIGELIDEAQEDEIQDDDDFQPQASWIKTEIATQINEDEIILIEDEDDELQSKVADWSSKLLSQNILSQVYPLDEEDQCDAESQAEQLFNDTNRDANNDNGNQLSELSIFMRHRLKAIRIDSSSSEDESEAICPAEKTTLQNSMLHSVKSIDILQSQQNDCDDLIAKDAHKKSEAERSDIACNKQPESPSTLKKPQKKSTLRKRNKSVSERSEIEELPVEADEPATELESSAKKRSPLLQNISKSCHFESPLSSPTRVQSSPKEDQNKTKKMSTEATPTKCSSRLQNRSKSCYMERPTLSVTKQQEKTTKDSKKAKEIPPEKMFVPEPAISPKKSKSKSSYKESPSTASTITIKDKNKQPPVEATEFVTLPEPAKALSPRLLNRSKSCYMERAISSPERSEQSTNKTPHSKSISQRSTDKSSTGTSSNDEHSRKPMVIAAPHLPKCRGKLRGVSAVSKEIKRKIQVLDRQRSDDYMAQMKKKWYQKSKDRKRECKQIKEKRREELKKLAAIPKSDAKAAASDGRKRKQTSVPTPGNCNRGEFLTKEVQPPISKKSKLDKTPAMPTKPKPVRRATIESFSQQLNAADLIKSPPTHFSRLPERKDAQKARNQRTCNRVTFADMDRQFEMRQKLNKLAKRVRFNDTPQIRIIERIGNIKVGNKKDTKKLTLSTYKERREWAHAHGKLDNFRDLIMGDILSWANQWLTLRSADAVAESDVLIPIPDEFKSFKQYRDTIIPLMKVELLATIERDYEISTDRFEVHLKSFSQDNTRNRPRFVLFTTYNQRIVKKFDLYTIYCHKNRKKTFANVVNTQRISGDHYELHFEILQEDITMEMLSGIKTLTVRPIVDNIRVEMGTFNAIYLLSRSPLAQRILQPSENVVSYDNKLIPHAAYKGYNKLNKRQIDICQRTWHRLVDDSTPSITLIQGPPGTGKSVIISNLTLQCIYGSSNIMLDRKILICAHSNAAVDNITYYLKRAHHAMCNYRFDVLRFGLFEKMNPNVQDISLNHYLKQKRDEKRNRLTADNILSLTNQQNELKMEIAELKKSSTKMNYMQQQLTAKERQLRLITEQLNPPLTPREEHRFSTERVERANIVCTTLSSCVKLANFIDYFDICIIDEATQCTEPFTLLPLRFGVRGLVLVGDTQQLPATVLSQKAIDFGLGNSMFARIQRNLQLQLERKRVNQVVHTKIFRLSTQYRMHPDICQWPNSYFYDNQLTNADCTAYLISPFIPYCVINLSYTQDTNDVSSRSISNDEEAHFVAKLLVEMNKHMPAERYKYGLITPYSNHCYTLSQVIPSTMKITPQTVDAYQGQERDIIILSNARTRGVGFLTNYQRLNVAITRPKRCLVICGNFDDLQSVQIWRHLLDDARSRNIYFDVKRSDVEDLNRCLISKMLVPPLEIPS
ncbi:probable helicase senataxin [Drosophila grimshawi]|uniref:GH15286 n=1 Tax=Drosophila grimshawi TaxID=7222 RepID=B4IWR8_DROGR|nr:probable helicase senataxin [Drosophila grimshawi]EDV96294.1 GH15286 [Drosophila grimshawi]